MQRVEFVFQKIDILFKWLSALVLGGMTIAIFLQVVFRYVFKSPLSWSEELARFLFIWMSFIAGYVGARQGKHIGVEALQNALPKICGAILKCFANIICTAFFSVIVYFTIQSWPKLMAQNSPALGIPMSFVYLSMILGSLFMGIWYLILAFKAFAKEPAPEPPTEVENL